MFKCTMRSVLRYRGHVTRQRQEELAEGERAFQAVDRELKAMVAAKRRAQGLLATYRASAPIRLSEATGCADYLRGASQRIARQAAVVQSARKYVEEKRAVLAEALKAERVIERLCERQRAAYLRNARRREQAQLDEVASRAHLRTGGKGLAGHEYRKSAG